MNYQEKLNLIVGSLEPFEQKVISMRFWLGEEHSHTLEEVGLAFDISRKKIRMIEAKVLVYYERMLHAIMNN